MECSRFSTHRIAASITARSFRRGARPLRAHEDHAVAALAQKPFFRRRALREASAPRRARSAPKVDRRRPRRSVQGRADLHAALRASATRFSTKAAASDPTSRSYQRDDLGTLLTSIVDPNAEIREGFVNQLVTTRDGRTLTGFVGSRDAAVVTLRGLDGQDVRFPAPTSAKCKRPR